MTRSFLLYSIGSLVAFCSLPLLASANSLNSYYCIAHHGTIHLGDPAAKVKAACGEPTQTTQGHQGRRQSSTKQIVTYSFVQANMAGSKVRNQRPKFSRVIHTKPDVVIELENSTIKAIRVGNKRKQKTSACGGSIKIGDSAKRLIRRCGRPTATHLVHQTQDQLSHQQQWEYHLGDYAQSLKLQFTNGRLSNIRFGAMGGSQ